MGRRCNILSVLVAFLESIKYTGHLIPVAFLRVYMGMYYIREALAKYQGAFLESPMLSDWITEGMAFSTAPHLYQEFLLSVVAPQWKIFAIVIFIFQFALGISFILGYLVRPFSIIAIFFALNAISFGNPMAVDLQKTFIAINIVLLWAGAGRCIGLDYYFYKRMRGLLW